MFDWGAIKESACGVITGHVNGGPLQKSKWFKNRNWPGKYGPGCL